MAYWPCFLVFHIPAIVVAAMVVLVAAALEAVALVAATLVMVMVSFDDLQH